MITDTEYKKRLNRAYMRLKDHGGWRAVADEFGLPSRTAWRLAMTDYVLKNAKKRAEQGLSALVPAPACAKCGQVHVTRRCTAGSNGHSRAPRRVAIRVDDMYSAAGTILRNLDPERVKKLVSILEAEGETQIP